MLTKTEISTPGACQLSASAIPIEWHPGMSIYASEGFLRAVGDEYGWIGGMDESGRLCCILPYTIVHKFGFRLVRFRVETLPVAGELTLAEEESFLNSAMKWLRSRGAQMVIPASASAIFRTYPGGASSVVYGTFINDLEQPEDVLWKAVSEAYRKDIRRAAKAGVEIKYGAQYLKPAHDIIAKTLNRSGMSFMSLASFERLVASLGESARLFVAIQNDVVQAALLSPFSQYSAYTLYGGTIINPVKGAMHLVHWEAMCQYRQLGVRRFNFMGVRINPQKGSKQEGIFHFKSRFGGELVQGYMWKYSLSRPHFEIYNLAARFMKGGDVVDQERRKALAS